MKSITTPFREKLKRFDICLLICTSILSLFSILLMLGIAPLSERIFGSDGVILCIIAISPTVFFICLSSVYRGYFQGLGRMRETAISQVIEAALKLVLGLIFAYIALRCGCRVPEIAAFAVLGLTLSSAVSVIYLAASKGAYEKRPLLLSRESEKISFGARETSFGAEKTTFGAEKTTFGADGTEKTTFGARETTFGAEKKSRVSRKSILKTLFLTAIPISLSALVMNITKIIDMTVILRRMQDIGYTSAEAFSAYGSYTTLALPLFSLAPALISSVALPLVPSLAGSVAAGDADGQVEVTSGAVKLTMIVSMPISIGLSLFSREILTLIFGSEPNAVALAAPLLSILALSIPLACLITVENAVLQAYSAASLPMISMAVGSAVKIILAYFLIGDRGVNIAGAPISTFVCDLTIGALNWHFIGKRLPRTVNMGIMIKPFFAAFISVGAARLAYSAIEARAGVSNAVTLACIALCALIYLPISLLIGAIGREEIRTILRRGRN